MTRQQLLELGLPERTISYRITAGDLVVVHAGVYALGHAERHALAVAHAAVLACGYEAALSHDSAGASWEIGDWPYTPEVTAPSRRSRPGIRTHRSTTLAGDVWTRHGIRTTSPVRTICDVASRRTDVQLTRLVQNARLKGHLSDAKLRQLLLRCPRVKDLVDPGQRPTRSTLEDDFVRWLKTHHLPMPQLNVMLNGYEVDALYEHEKLIIELDSWTYHGNPRAFGRDHHRDSVHRASGYDTVRLTGEQLTDAEAVTLRRTLSGRSSAG